MAMQGSDVAGLISHFPDFGRRCRLIALAYGINVVAVEDPATANHANRVALVNKILNGAFGETELAYVVLSDPNIQAAALADIANGGAAVADANIDARLQGAWNAIANAAAA